jgi:hypothetical protein
VKGFNDTMLKLQAFLEKKPEDQKEEEKEKKKEKEKEKHVAPQYYLKTANDDEEDLEIQNTLKYSALIQEAK